MSVTVSVNLPDQPVIGSTRTIPLGGNGFVSPHSVSQMRCVAEGDATGGFCRINVGFDPRYVQLVSTVDALLVGVTAATELDMSLTESAEMQIGFNEDVLYNPTSGLGGTNRVSWAPSPLLLVAGAADPLLPPALRVNMTNVDGDDLWIYLSVFNFDRRVREKVPFEIITSCLTRTSSVI